MKKKLDSKNKKTELLHELTRFNYKPVRAALRRNRWDFVAAFLELKGGLTTVQYDAAIAAANKALQDLARMFENLREPIEQMIETAFNWTVETTAKIVSTVTPAILAAIDGNKEDTGA
jgi:hypothetical protein